MDPLDTLLIAMSAIGFSMAFTAEPVEGREISIRIERAVPVVPGIREAPSPLEYYQAQPEVAPRPAASFYQLDTDAPPNGCVRPSFRILSGPVAERGCYGE